MASDFRREVRGILGITTNGGEPMINGLHPKFITCEILRCQDLWITGSLKTSFSFANGSIATPSINFASDPTTGLYLATPGAIGFTGEGIGIFTASSLGLSTQVPIITPAGNLVLDPNGPSIDCSGKTLINVAGISTNPNRFEVVGTMTTTTTAAPTIILTIPLDPAGYNMDIDVVFVTGTSVGTYTAVVQAKKTGSASMILLTSNAKSDPALSAALVVASASGNNIIVTATGIVATSINWQAAASVTRVLY